MLHSLFFDAFKDVLRLCMGQALVRCRQRMLTGLHGSLLPDHVRDAALLDYGFLTILVADLAIVFDILHENIIAD